MNHVILTVALKTEQDAVAVRRRARQIAEMLGFQALEQTRIATAVSEIARNAFRYAGGGRVEFSLRGAAPQIFEISILDQGPGISGLPAILAGRYRSETGMGLGIIGARRLMDHFEIESVPARGSRVVLGKNLPPIHQVTAPQLAEIAQQLMRRVTEDPVEEVQAQNRELLLALELVHQQKAELVDTNRGIRTLMAELEDKAESLSRANELKSRFLANMSHEFRTPLSSVLSLSRLLLDRTDGELTTEQEIQLKLIRASVEELSDVVNDLLDLSKVQAGRMSVNAAEFSIGELFSALRGMMRPLVKSGSVELIFEAPAEVPLYTDEGKIAQILRNLISNSLKFTEQGHVRISATCLPHGRIVFSVEDTGLGIALADQERIFEEFGQLDNPVQRRVKGTGLGLPLSRRLAEVLGGTLTVCSEPGVGSTFLLTLPLSYAAVEPTDRLPPVEPAHAPALASPPGRLEPGERLLLIDDSSASRYMLRRLLIDSSQTIFEAEGGRQGVRLASELSPDVIFLDLVMPDMSGFEVLEELKASPLTRHIPVIIHTSMRLTPEQTARLAAMSAAILPKESVSHEMDIDRLSEAMTRARQEMRATRQSGE